MPAAAATRSRRLSEIDLRAWSGFLRAHAEVKRALERDLERAGLIQLSDYGVLLELARGPAEGRRPIELASLASLTKSGLTRLVDRLETAGLVERRACASDQRGNLIALTARGRHVFRRAAPMHLRGIARYFVDRLDHRERAILARAFEKLIHQEHRPSE
ncbi:MAG: MarR family transcriptional regulator [Chloroflexota bacterium]|nr:MarR family transcriptional regulator [Chloroflexota bacterium]